MKPARIRYLVIFFAAMFLANNAVAVARACMLGLTAQEHPAIQMLDIDCDGNMCPEAHSPQYCIGHCTQSCKSYEQKVSFDAPAFSIAPPVSPHRIWLAAEPRALVVAWIPPVVGPALIILFGNLRI